MGKTIVWVPTTFLPYNNSRVANFVRALHTKPGCSGSGKKNIKHSCNHTIALSTSSQRRKTLNRKLSKALSQGQCQTGERRTTELVAQQAPSSSSAYCSMLNPYRVVSTAGPKRPKLVSSPVKMHSQDHLGFRLFVHASISTSWSSRQVQGQRAHISAIFKTRTG